jgi:hypothetical protein
MKNSILMAFCILLLISIFDGCTPDYKNKDPKIRIAAIEKITNQKLLANIVFEDTIELVREAAVVRLTDQVLLSKIAIEHKNAYTRLTAIANLTDTTTLVKVIFNKNESSLFRQIANQRLQKLTGVQKYSFN